MRPRRTILAALALALLATACTSSDDESAPATTTTTPVTTSTTGSATTTTTAGDAGWIPCRNDALSFEVSYPPGWHVAAPLATSPDTACRFFSPEPIEVIPNSEGPFAPLMVEVAPSETAATFVSSAVDPTFNDVQTRDTETIGGHPGTLVDAVATGEGLYPAGYRTTVFVLDDDTTGAAAVSAHSLPTDSAETHAQRVALLRKMIATFHRT